MPTICAAVTARSTPRSTSTVTPSRRRYCLVTACASTTGVWLPSTELDCPAAVAARGGDDPMRLRHWPLVHGCDARLPGREAVRYHRAKIDRAILLWRAQQCEAGR